MLPFAFEDGFGFERYADHALDVPMYFVIRNKRYINAAGESFRAFLEGKLPQLPGEKPTIKDWEDHLSTLFPEVRLKQFLEMRGADMGDRDHVIALAAIWVGLLYDADVLDAAKTLTRMLLALLLGEPLRETILHHAGRWFSERKAALWSKEPDLVVIGRHVSPACYIRESFPAALYLAWKYADDFEAAVVANTMVGGDNCHRGAVVGALVGAACGHDKLPAAMRDGLVTVQPMVKA